jgi:predicted Zn finger-like uncharacterized protein
MSLATRCTSCNTAFRVDQDQLKASEGWVRCGRCNEVFSALNGLFELVEPSSLPANNTPQDVDKSANKNTHPVVQSVSEPRHTPPLVLPPTTKTASQELVLTKQYVEIASLLSRNDTTKLPSSEKRSNALSLTDKIDSQLMSLADNESQFTPSKRVMARDRLDFPDAQFDSDDGNFDPEPQPVEFPSDVDGNANTPPEMAHVDEELDALPSEPPTDAPVGADLPEFIRRTQRQALWQTPKMRAVLVGLAVMLAGVLLLQVVYHFRDTVAARWPTSQPLLAAWCKTVGCALDAPRRIEDISVENSALVQTPEANAFKLMLSLRNKGTLPVAMPAIEFGLTDAAGQLIARRVLMPQDFQTADKAIAGGADSALQLTLTTGPIKINGYTVEVFYP